MIRLPHLPRLLTPDLRERCRLRPSRASATINLTPLSTASLTLSPDDPGVAVRDWVALDGPDGPLGVFRVAAASSQDGDCRQLSLEHGAATLEDDLAPPGMTLSGDLRGMLAALLACQSDPRWALGEVDVSGPLPAIAVGGENLLQALLDALSLEDAAMLAFDQSSLPWRVHVRRKPAVAACECRLNRNLLGVSITQSDAELCTRAVIEGSGQTFDAETLPAWGVVARTIAVPEGRDPAAEARRYLEARQQPTVSVTLDAMALAALTGEPLDRFAVGALCRVALPDAPAPLDERIVAIAYPDLYGQPGLARLTLSNRRADASARLARLRSAAAAGRAAVRTAEKKAADKARDLEQRIDDDRQAAQEGLRETVERVERTERSLDLHATHLDELDHSLSGVGIDLDAARAQITLHAERIDLMDGSMTQARLDIDGANARITANAQALDAQGNRLSGAELRLDGLDASISLKADKTVTDSLGTRVSSAEIDIRAAVQTLNGLQSQITLKADRIDLQGLVTATELSTSLAAIQTQLSQYISSSEVWTGYLDATNIYGENVVASHLTANGYDTAWRSTGYVSGVTAAAERVVQRQNITYMGSDGQSHFVSVVTGLTNLNANPTFTTGTMNYLGR